VQQSFSGYVPSYSLIDHSLLSNRFLRLD